MQNADKVGELAFFCGLGARGDGDIDFVDARGCAEIAERLGGVRGDEDGGTFPNPEAVNESGRSLRGSGERTCGQEEREGERGVRAAIASCGSWDHWRHGGLLLRRRNWLKEATT